MFALASDSRISVPTGSGGRVKQTSDCVGGLLLTPSCGCRLHVSTGCGVGWIVGDHGKASCLIWFIFNLLHNIMWDNGTCNI